MTVQELLTVLQEFNPELEVTITDGFDCRHYRGAFELKLFEDLPSKYVVDIGIGIGIGGKIYEGE